MLSSEAPYIWRIKELCGLKQPLIWSKPITIQCNVSYTVIAWNCKLKKKSRLTYNNRIEWAALKRHADTAWHNVYWHHCAGSRYKAFTSFFHALSLSAGFAIFTALFLRWWCYKGFHNLKVLAKNRLNCCDKTVLLLQVHLAEHL